MSAPSGQDYRALFVGNALGGSATFNVPQDKVVDPTDGKSKDVARRAQNYTNGPLFQAGVAEPDELFVRRVLVLAYLWPQAFVPLIVLSRTPATQKDIVRAIALGVHPVVGHSALRVSYAASLRRHARWNELLQAAGDFVYNHYRTLDPVLDARGNIDSAAPEEGGRVPDAVAYLARRMLGKFSSMLRRFSKDIMAASCLLLYRNGVTGAKQAEDPEFVDNVVRMRATYADTSSLFDETFGGFTTELDRFFADCPNPAAASIPVLRDKLRAYLAEAGVVTAPNGAGYAILTTLSLPAPAGAHWAPVDATVAAKRFMQHLHAYGFITFFNEFPKPDHRNRRFQGVYDYLAHDEANSAETRVALLAVLEENWRSYPGADLTGAARASASSSSSSSARAKPAARAAGATRAKSKAPASSSSASRGASKRAAEPEDEPDYDQGGDAGFDEEEEDALGPRRVRVRRSAPDRRDALPVPGGTGATAALPAASSAIVRLDEPESEQDRLDRESWDEMLLRAENWRYDPDAPVPPPAASAPPAPASSLAAGVEALTSALSVWRTDNAPADSDFEMYETAAAKSPAMWNQEALDAEAQMQLDAGGGLEMEDEEEAVTFTEETFWTTLALMERAGHPFGLLNYGAEQWVALLNQWYGSVRRADAWAEDAPDADFWRRAGILAMLRDADGTHLHAFVANTLRAKPDNVAVVIAAFGDIDVDTAAAFTEKESSPLLFMMGKLLLGGSHPAAALITLDEIKLRENALFAAKLIYHRAIVAVNQGLVRIADAYTDVAAAASISDGHRFWAERAAPSPPPAPAAALPSPAPADPGVLSFAPVSPPAAPSPAIINTLERAQSLISYALAAFGDMPMRMASIDVDRSGHITGRPDTAWISRGVMAADKTK